MNLSADQLRAQLSFDAECGLFRWRANKGKHKAGDIAGCVNLPGYIVIRVSGVLYRAHRLAWLYVTGRWPLNGVDHINGIRSDNRFSNLREADQAQNLQNQRTARADNESERLGVSRDPRRDRWRARITIGLKQKWLGYFDSAEEAHAAYLRAKRELHEFCTV
jgi:HNH endonuclease/AP2 domain